MRLGFGFVRERGLVDEVFQSPSAESTGGRLLSCYSQTNKDICKCGVAYMHISHRKSHDQRRGHQAPTLILQGCIGATKEKAGNFLNPRKPSRCR